nr:hypothetical protein CFP56_00767 [Quercus suber]
MVSQCSVLATRWCVTRRFAKPAINEAIDAYLVVSSSSRQDEERRIRKQSEVVQIMVDERRGARNGVNMCTDHQVVTIRKMMLLERFLLFTCFDSHLPYSAERISRLQDGCKIDALYECCDLFYKRNGDQESTMSCPKPSLLRYCALIAQSGWSYPLTTVRLKMKQRADGNK